VAARLNFWRLPFRVFPDIDDDLAANYRGDRSKTDTATPCESAAVAAQIASTLMQIAIASTCGFSRKEDRSVLSAFEQFRKPRGFFGDAIPC
jgi:hypothetical protein